MDAPTSPRNVLRTAYVADPASLGEDEELLLDSVLSTAIGEDNYPGDATTVTELAGSRPGRPRRAEHHGAEPLPASPTSWSPSAVKPPITWVRGDADAIVSDTSLFDLAYLGSLGLVPGWPGADACPPQPMVGQTRAVLERYAAAGGEYRELVYPECGHSPHVERRAEFAAALLDLIA